MKDASQIYLATFITKYNPNSIFKDLFAFPNVREHNYVYLSIYVQVSLS